MGLCNDCVYYTKRGTSFLDGVRNSVFGMNGCNDIGFCTCSMDSYGNYRKVKGLDACHCGGYTPKSQWK